MPKGRTRSLTAEAAILDATEALPDELSPSKISADLIAQRAGVSKATLYKWWPSKSYILMDAVLRRASHDIPLPNTGSAASAFKLLLEGFIRFHLGTAFGAAVSHLFAEGLDDPELMNIYNTRYPFPRRELLKEIWGRAVEKGEVRRDVDPDLVLDMLYGPLVYRFFLRHREISPELAQDITRVLFTGLNV
ncbi:TetR/AcrR family transcriptional regulator [Asticcacaulis sp. AND118]|uniref:TetR/AcrR family transcriptional regulator n=1 Tax=Asticcacaulis sp. AND118 TaxID=2840468 RepID=UPI001CFF80D0|nr:TetR/AcrR family transcriptional regulator [Asticcacaulis sp. AND118]UDF05756.1 TetR/AcrR family transcriptional regulator [Asticcacaulis sp. AND118]